jgi:uncharacterized protein (TIGR04222 family)
MKERPVPAKTYRRIASAAAGAGAVLGLVRTIDQLQYDPPLGWMVLAAITLVLLVLAIALWPKRNRSTISN